jgi:hypothetical protein
MVLAAKDGRQREQEQTEAAERVFPFLLWPLRFRVCFPLSAFCFSGVVVPKSLSP